ncbi:dual specificity protein phosphatase family protein [Rhizobium jaguaris]|uniref:dual specificity protein phosphatase family protein n=1 Tax=Rhizobium jaguaris TaxID=1312183 RepID=UPI0039BF7DB7
MSIVVFTLIGSLGLSCGAYAAHLQLSGNFHPVIEGQLYRSAQPTADQLAYVRARGIKTIINLRGYHPGAEWYDPEVAMANGFGIGHIDFGISASKMVSAQKAAEIVSLMASAPKPILIHCQSGADRSGLVAALYMRKVAGWDEYKALGQLSFYYGHVGIPIVSSAYAIDRSWQDIGASDRKQAGGVFESSVALR